MDSKIVLGKTNDSDELRHLELSQFKDDDNGSEIQSEQVDTTWYKGLPGCKFMNFKYALKAQIVASKLPTILTTIHKISINMLNSTPPWSGAVFNQIMACYPLEKAMC